MLRQSCRFIFSRQVSFCRQTNISSTSRRGFSSIKNQSSDLTLKLLASGFVLGGSTLIAYKYGYFGGSKTAEHGSHDSHEAPVPKQSTPVVKSKIVEKLPEYVPYLIIGGGTTGFSASRAIRSNDPKARVLIISAEDYFPYMKPPLSKELWYSGSDLKEKFTFKQWNGREKSIFFEHEEFYLPLDQFESSPTGGITVVKGQRVVKIDPTDRRAYLENGQIISYNKCLIATGCEAKNLPIFENASHDVQDRVILFRSLNDFKKLNELLFKCKSITIIGGGLLGSELACSLSDKSRRTKLNVQINQILPDGGVLERILPKYLSKWCSSKVQEEGLYI